MGNTTETNLPAGVVVLEDIRAQYKAGTLTTKQYDAAFAPGTRFFVRATGSYGTVLAEVDEKGKKLAEMTCTLGGPNHKRRQSDWHQSGVSPEMKKAAKKAKKSADEVVAAAEAVRQAATTTLNAAREGAGLEPKLQAAI